MASQKTPGGGTASRFFLLVAILAWTSGPLPAQTTIPDTPAQDPQVPTSPHTPNSPQSPYSPHGPSSILPGYGTHRDASTPPNGIPANAPFPNNSGGFGPRSGMPEAYQEPKLDGKPFDVAKISLTSAQKSETATQLATVMRLIASKTPRPPCQLAAKAVGLALLLDPENRAAIITNLQFVKNIRFENIPEEPSAATVAQNLFQLAQSLKDQTDEDSRSFRRYLMEVAHEIHPANEDLLFEQEMLRRKEGPADWSKILGGSQASSVKPTTKATYKQISILSLMVSQLDSGDFAGRAMNITATLTPREISYSSQASLPPRLQIAGAVGKEMSTSFDETTRAIKARGINLPAGGDVMISFGQKYSSKDGPSASVALALLLMALSDQIKLDPKFAVTGDMNVDGTVHSIGGVSAKIRGASLADCSRMAIPEENMRDLEDMAILKEFGTIWQAQIFTIKSLDEATVLAAQEPGPELAKGLAAFAELQEFCRKNPPGTTFSSPFIRQKLAETLAATPNHASALILQKHIDNRLPKTLSLNTSINEIFLAAGPFFDFIYRSKRSNYSTSSSGYSRPSSPRETVFSFAPEVYDRATDRLYVLAAQIDPLASDLHIEVNNLIRNWRSASQRTYSPTEIKRLIEAAEKVDTSIQKMRDDHKIQEILAR